MKTPKFLDRRVGSTFAALAILLGAVVPAALPAFASADILTERSIALSSSKANDSAVTYNVKFKTVGGAGAAVIDFCSDSPIPGQTCTLPTGLTTASVNTSTSGATATPILSNRGVKIVYTMAATTSITVDLTGIHNPTAVGTFYARILTYADDTAAGGYTSATAIGSPIDQGGVALATTTAIGISASVRESLTFCVAGYTQEISDNCGDASTVGHEPTLVLGQDDGSGSKALASNAISTGDIYTQLSTNAAGGVTVSMKSNAVGCGGLVRQGAATNNCNITPETGTSSFLAGAAKFGVTVAGATDGTGAFGTITNSGNYDASDYYMGYVSGDATGVTSAYGDPIFSSDGPAANKNNKLTFGASVAPQTPAGNYKASLNLIATGIY
ncbi:hypothetical protein EYC59_02695 [Candidatus Saccharibacteria bacterium]|nr:MAG: hypothetical protein EYC59_02695 [Candidatus Saccharibacteria bacterium]